MTRLRVHDSKNELYTRFRYSPIKGLEYEQGVNRRDPSSIIEVDDQYYVWYTRNQSTKSKWLDADIWYATSSDGITWNERGPAVSRGPEKDTIQYTEDGVNFEVMASLEDIPPAGGAYIADKFTDPENGQGFSWGLAHYGRSDWNFLVRFDCGLQQGMKKQLSFNYFPHYSAIRDVMRDPDRFEVPREALTRKPTLPQARE
jgi:hypothetical protein